MKPLQLIGKTFGRLTIISRETNSKRGNSCWNCLCVCGNYKICNSDRLQQGKITSCGCGKSERAISNAKKLTKYNPVESSALHIWRSYYKDLPFSIFTGMSQLVCHYCDVGCSNSFNRYNKLGGEFIYNGIDRINSNLPHIVTNSIPACKLCNRFKSNYTYEDYINWVSNIYKNNQPINLIQTNLPNNKYILGSSKHIWRSSYDEELLFEEFYSLSQMNCFYCDVAPNNLSNKYTAKNTRSSTAKNTRSSLEAKLNGNFIYNGLDRIDSNKNHSIDNIVPCCYRCNRAKSDLTLEEFKNHIVKVYKNIEVGKFINTSIVDFNLQYIEAAKIEYEKLNFKTCT